LPEAGKYLKGRAEWWLTWPRAQKDHGTVCMSCHTTVQYLLTQSVVRSETNKDKEEPSARLLKSVRQRVQQWDKVEPHTQSRAAQSRGSESILNLLALALDDATAGRKQSSEDTSRAIANLWALQIKTGDRQGAWEWIEAGLAPWEIRAEYFGASLAAFALATVPGYLANAPEQDRKQFDLLRAYLKANFARQNLHERLTVAWASAKWADVLSSEDKQRLLDDALAKQNADGGWSTASLGDWKRANGKAQSAASDGYGTGLVVAALKRLAKDEQRNALEKGLLWLRTHQSAADGSWQAASLNRDYAKDSEVGRFMTDAATGWAILALSEAK